MDWSKKKFPEFFHALRYVLVERSPALIERIGQTLRQHLESGKVLFADASLERNSAAIVFANEFFDALPVEIVSDRGSLRIDTSHGSFAETWVAASSEELEFLDRYSAVSYTHLTLPTTPYV